MKAKPGEVWLADLGLASKVRPVLVVSRSDPDAPRALTIYVPLTTQSRGSRYEVPMGNLSFLNPSSVVNVQGIGAVIEPRLERKLGRVPPEVMVKVKEAIRFALDLQ
jgi:mRNA interferase MazF